MIEQEMEQRVEGHFFTIDFEKNKLSGGRSFQDPNIINNKGFNGSVNHKIGGFVQITVQDKQQHSATTFSLKSSSSSSSSLAPPIRFKPEGPAIQDRRHLVLASRILGCMLVGLESVEFRERDLGSRQAAVAV